MTTLKLVAAAAVATSLIASPVLAMDAKNQPDRQTMKMQKTGKQARMQTPARTWQGGNWRNDRAADVQYDRRYDRGEFWPGAVAAGIVGGAVSTAGAIATAPFRETYAYDSAYDDSYAAAPTYRSNWDNGWDNTYNSNWNNGWDRSYAARNGFVCTPGSLFTNENGRTQLCQ